MPRLRAERARLPPPVTRRCPRTGAMEDEERLKKLEAGKAKVRGGCGGAGTGTRGGDGGCGGGPGSARLDSAPRGPAANKASGAGCALCCPGSPSLLPSLPPCQPAAGDGHVAGSATGGGEARLLAASPPSLLSRGDSL